MPTKVSEKHLFLGIALLLIGVVILLNTTLVDRPIKISEKGLLFDLMAVVSLFFSVRFISKSIHRQ
jgi:uncharacterized membrane protein